MMYWHNGVGGWSYVMMALNMVIFWGLVVAGIVLLVRYLGPGRPGGRDGGHAEPILAERFARGEIDVEEYRRRLDTLRRAGQASGDR